MQQRFKILPIVSVILKKDDQVFLIRCSPQASFPGAYTLVGGHVDGGETFKQAAAREAREEIGVEINLEDLTLIHVNNRKRDDGQEIIWLVFLAQKWSGIPTNKEPHKHDIIGFYHLDNLPTPIRPPFFEELFKNLCNGSLYSESGW